MFVYPAYLQHSFEFECDSQADPTVSTGRAQSEGEVLMTEFQDTVIDILENKKTHFPKSWPPRFLPRNQPFWYKKYSWIPKVRKSLHQRQDNLHSFERKLGGHRK